MTSPTPGWYPDPQVPAQMRWWDGSTWTDDVYERVEPPGGYLSEGATKPGPASARAAQQPTSALTAPTTPDGVALASWGQRAAARVIDSLITGTIGLLLALPWVSDAVRHMMDVSRSAQAVTNPLAVYDSRTLRALAIATLVSLVVSLVYELVFLLWKAATPGKLALRLRVRPWEAAGPLGSGVIARRLLGFQVLGQVPTFGSIYSLVDVLWPLWDPRRQAVHDKIAGTCVVAAPRGHVR